MSYGVDKLKSQIAKSNGIAVGNQWVMVLPRVRGSILESRELNILTKEILFPGRAHTSQPRVIGVKGIDVANGYHELEIIARFHILNDWGIVDYFYKWQDLVLDQTSKYVGYLNDYGKSFRLHALQKNQSYDFAAARKTKNLNALFDLLGINLDIDQDFGQKTRYAIEVIDAYPSDVNPIPLDNSQDNLLELVVQFKFLTWRRI